MSTKLVRTLFPFLTAVILVPAAYGKRSKGPFLCAESIATTSTYYTPSAKVICKSTTPCQEFKDIVDIQGSGTLKKGTILTHTGKRVDIGNCETSIGKGNTCLIPYVSVAADLQYHELGDIIEMPSLKGKVLTLPNGKKFKHPGYFIVDDKGAKSHVQGENRFDVYTGPHGLDDPDNEFGTKASRDLRMTDRKECGANKTFTAIKPGDAKYKPSQVAIDQSLHAAGEEPVFASNYSPSSVKPTSKSPYSQSLGVR